MYWSVRRFWPFVLFALVLGCVAQAAEDSAAATESLIQRYQLEQSPTPVKERAGWRRPQRILVGGPASAMVPALKVMAPDIEFTVADRDDMARQAASADVLFGICSPEALAAAKSVQWIHLLSAGVERCVSIPAVRERNILVTNMQRIGGPIIAEHVMAMTLAFTRALDFYIPARARHEWRAAPEGRTEVIQGKTMLVVGLGGIGSEVAKRAHALGMRVVATRARGRTGPDFVDYVGLPGELHKLATGADFVVNTAPLTPQTKGIFDAAFFAKMKPTAYFINIARGGSVVTDALVAALQNKQIAGAGLDVTDPEPLPPGHPLWNAPNVIITPHVANDSDLGYGVQVAISKENLRRYIAGERMLSVVDVARGY